MQIYDITNRKQQLTEASFTDYVKAAFTKDPNMANLPLDQRAAAMMKDTAMQNVAKLALQQWQSKVLTLIRANQNMPITDREYTDNLKDFIEKTLLQKPLTTLDQLSRQRLGVQINNVLASRNDPKKLQQTFQELAVNTAAARQDPTRVGRQYAQAAAQAPTGSAQAGSAQQTSPLIKRFMQSTVNASQLAGLQQFLAQNVQGGIVRSTGNAVVDAFINHLGVKTR